MAYRAVEIGSGWSARGSPGVVHRVDQVGAQTAGVGYVVLDGGCWPIRPQPDKLVDPELVVAHYTATKMTLSA